MSGFVYAAARSDGLIKLGFSRNPRRRLFELRKIYNEVVMLGVMAGNDRDELRVHRMFFADRVSGEWFRKSDALKEFIASLAPLPETDISIGNEMRVWRRSSGLTLASASRKIGMSPAMLSRIENGINSVKPERVPKVERITGISRHVLRPDIFGPAKGRAA